MSNTDAAPVVINFLILLTCLHSSGIRSGSVFGHFIRLVPAWRNSIS